MPKANKIVGDRKLTFLEKSTANIYLSLEGEGEYLYPLV